MSKLEEIFDFDIKPELPDGEMVEFVHGFDKINSISETEFRLFHLYNTKFPKAFEQMHPTAYSTESNTYLRSISPFWAKAFAYLNSNNPVMYEGNSSYEIAKVPFMFKLVIPDEWLAELDAECNHFYWP